MTTAATMQGDHPPTRVKHTWRCTQRSVLVETVRTDALGRGHVVLMCQQCGGDDLADRLRAEREATT
jgi:hypothetical protein